MHTLTPELLTRAQFAPFGDVIDRRDVSPLVINGGRTQRYDDLAVFDLLGQDSRPRISLFLSKPVALPLEINALERHPLGSQAFMPLHSERFLVVVAPAGGAVDLSTVRAFITDGHQGVNYRAGTWHAVHAVLDQEGEFLVIDRAGPGANCDEQQVSLTVAL